MPDTTATPAAPPTATAVLASAAARDTVAKPVDAAAPTAPPPAAPAAKVDATAQKPADAKVDPAKPAEPPESQRFADWGKKEAARLQKEQELKTKEAALAKQSTELEQAKADAQKLREIQALPKGQRLVAIAKHFGWGSAQEIYSSLTEEALSLPTDTDAVKKADLEAFEKKLADKEAAERATKEKAEKEQAEKQREATVRAWHGEIDGFIKSNASVYELTALEEGATELIAKVIEAHFKETSTFDESGRISKRGKVLSTEEAVKLVEAHLEEQLEKRVATKKFEAKFKQVPKEAEKASEKPVDGAPKSLSNALGPTAASTTGAASTDPDERYRRAVETYNRMRKPAPGQ